VKRIVSLRFVSHQNIGNSLEWNKSFRFVSSRLVFRTSIGPITEIPPHRLPLQNLSMSMSGYVKSYTGFYLQQILQVYGCYLQSDHSASYTKGTIPFWRNETSLDSCPENLISSTFNLFGKENLSTATLHWQRDKFAMLFRLVSSRLIRITQRESSVKLFVSFRFVSPHQSPRGKVAWNYSFRFVSFRLASYESPRGNIAWNYCFLWLQSEWIQWNSEDTI
jgi:hypothetical protein